METGQRHEVESLFSKSDELLAEGRQNAAIAIQRQAVAVADDIGGGVSITARERVARTYTRLGDRTMAAETFENAAERARRLAKSYTGVAAADLQFAAAALDKDCALVQLEEPTSHGFATIGKALGELTSLAREMPSRASEADRFEILWRLQAASAAAARDTNGFEEVPALIALARPALVKLESRSNANVKESEADVLTIVRYCTSLAEAFVVKRTRSMGLDCVRHARVLARSATGAEVDPEWESTDARLDEVAQHLDEMPPTQQREIPCPYAPEEVLIVPEDASDRGWPEYIRAITDRWIANAGVTGEDKLYFVLRAYDVLAMKALERARAGVPPRDVHLDDLIREEVADGATFGQLYQSRYMPIALEEGFSPTLFLGNIHFGIQNLQENFEKGTQGYAEIDEDFELTYLKMYRDYCGTDDQAVRPAALDQRPTSGSVEADRPPIEHVPPTAPSQPHVPDTQTSSHSTFPKSTRSRAAGTTKAPSKPLMSAGQVWIVFAIVALPILLIASARSDKPVAYFVVMGLFFTFAAAAGNSLYEIGESAKEQESRRQRQRLDDDTARDVARYGSGDDRW